MKNKLHEFLSLVFIGFLILACVYLNIKSHAEVSKWLILLGCFIPALAWYFTFIKKDERDNI